MRFIYAHFLEGEYLGDFMTSREHPRPNIRHITRKKLYGLYGCTYDEIAKAEAVINGGHKIDLSTIHHSVHKPPQKYESYGEAERAISDLIRRFEVYWIEMDEPDIQGRMGHYYGLPHHVLAVIVSFAESFGWVERAKLEGLEREFKTLSKEFVEKEIEL